jgi:hypothetical protein
MVELLNHWINFIQPPDLMAYYRLPYDKMFVFCWLNPVESPSDTKKRFVQRLGVSKRPDKLMRSLEDRWRIVPQSLEGLLSSKMDMFWSFFYHQKRMVYPYFLHCITKWRFNLTLFNHQKWRFNDPKYSKIGWFKPYELIMDLGLSGNGVDRPSQSMASLKWKMIKHEIEQGTLVSAKDAHFASSK